MSTRPLPRHAHHSKKCAWIGSAAVVLFRNITESGSHEVRLIDATGMPYEEKNVAKDEFEKEGIKQLKQGKPYYEKIVEKNGKPYLRALTPVPVVVNLK